MAKELRSKEEIEAAKQEALKPSGTPRLQTRYDEEIRAKFAEKFGIANRMAQPKLQKIVINVNMGRHLDGTKVPANVKNQVLDTLTKISGQKPVMIQAKKSVSNFKVRAGYETAAMVTLRRDRMWHFIDKMINLASPRINRLTISCARAARCVASMARAAWAYRPAASASPESTLAIAATACSSTDRSKRPPAVASNSTARRGEPLSRSRLAATASRSSRSDGTRVRSAKNSSR